MRPEHKGLLCAIGATFFFGCGSTALKLIYRYFDQIPFQDLSLIRSAFCMLVFLLVLLRKDPALLRVGRRELAFFVFSGVCGMFLVQFCLLLGLQLAPVGVCSFTQSSSTIMVCLCSVALFHEKISREKRLGIAVGLAGLAFVVWNPEILRGGRMFAWGVLAAFASGVGKTVYMVCGKLAGQRGRKLPLMFYGMAASSLMGLPFSNGLPAAASYFLDWRAALVLAGYLLAFSALPYLLTFRSIELLPASTAGALNVVEPLAATVSAFLVLGEPLLWNHILGAALTVTSVLLIHRDAGAPAEPDEPKRQGGNLP